MIDRRRRCWNWSHYLINEIAFEHPAVSSPSPTSKETK